MVNIYMPRDDADGGVCEGGKSMKKSKRGIYRTNKQTNKHQNNREAMV